MKREHSPLELAKQSNKTTTIFFLSLSDYFYGLSLRSWDVVVLLVRRGVVGPQTMRIVAFACFGPVRYLEVSWGVFDNQQTRGAGTPSLESDPLYSKL